MIETDYDDTLEIFWVITFHDAQMVTCIVLLLFRLTDGSL